MKTRIFSTIGSVCCAIAILSHNSQADTLEQVFLDALENDHQFKAAQAELDAGLEYKNLGRAPLLPQLGGDASWTKTYPQDADVAPEVLPGGSIDVDPALNPVGGSESAVSKEYSVRLSQNIVDLSAWHTYQRGKALTSVAQAQFVVAKQNLIIRVAEAYFDALQAVDNLISAKAEEDALSHQLEQTRQRFEVGLTAITEVHEAQAAFDSATANRLVADGELGIAFEALEVLTGRPHEQLAPLKNDFPVQAPEPLARDEWVEQALDQNARLQTARFVAKAAKSAAKVAKSEHLPKLSGSVGYSKVDREEYPGQIGAYDTEGGVVSLNLNVPLFSGGRISASRRQAYSEFLAEQERYLQTQRDVIQRTRSYHLGVITAAATVKARAQAITSANSALEATRAGYDVGTRDLVDVLNAQRNLYRNQRDYFDALYAYVMSTLQLREAAGMLSAEDIASLSQWLNPARAAEYRRQ